MFHHVMWNVEPEDIKVGTVVTDDMICIRPYMIDGVPACHVASTTPHYFFCKEDVIGKRAVKQLEDKGAVLASDLE